MNNFTFGNAQSQYHYYDYEAVAGGSGAGPGFEVADIVQTQMTNSRLTDREVLAKCSNGDIRFSWRVSR